jgi:SNF2 family DNA or RNA helicase
MDPGSGKTLVSLELVESTKCDLCLWICPLSLCDEIRNEYKKWNFTFNLKIVGCESIGSSERIFRETMQLINGKKVFCVVDESITIKNSNALRTNRIIAIGKKCEYRLILNGTPVSKNIIDLWAQMEFLSPLILKMSYSKYKNTFTEYYVRGRMRGMVKTQHNIEYLTKLISPYIFEADLSLSVGKVYYDYTYDNEFKDEYNEIKNKYLSMVDDRGVDFFAMSTELQVCYTKSVQKYNLINDLTSNDEQYIIFVRYLENIPKDEMSITGSLSPGDRSVRLKQFKNDKFRILYMTYGTGGRGLNLQFCRNIIFADQTFDYTMKLQSEYRIFRKGQIKNVNYYNLWCNTGMERIFKACLEKKTRLLDEVKKEIQKNGGRDI